MILEPLEVSAPIRAKHALTCFWSDDKITLANYGVWRKAK